MGVTEGALSWGLRGFLLWCLGAGRKGQTLLLVSEWGIQSQRVLMYSFSRYSIRGGGSHAGRYIQEDSPGAWPFSLPQAESVLFLPYEVGFGTELTWRLTWVAGRC